MTTQKPDPIFAAIENHRARDALWETANSALNNRPDEPGPERGRAMVDNLFASATAALHELLTTTPTTRTGAVALLKYVQAYSAIEPDFLEIHSVPGFDKASAALIAQLIACLESLPS